MKKQFNCYGYNFLKKDVRPFVRAHRQWKGETFANRWLGRKPLSDDAFAEKISPIVKNIMATTTPRVGEELKEAISRRFGHEFIEQCGKADATKYVSMIDG